MLRARELGVDLPTAATFRSVTGKGIEAEIEGRVVTIGNRALMAQTGIVLDGLGSRAEELARTGATPMYVTVDGRPAGLIAVADTLKPESRRRSRNCLRSVSRSGC